MRNLMILAKWLAAQADVDVVAYNGDTARIQKLENGRKIIRLPRHWCAVKDEESVALLEGVIDHEALGHGRFTNFDDDDVAKARGYDMNGFTRSVSNVLEDVMIETKAIATYPGVKFNLSRTVKILMEKHGFFGSPDQFKSAPPSALLMAGLLNCLRSACVPGQDEILGDHAEILHELLEVHFGDVWKTIFEIGMEVKKSEQTIDNWELTQRIVDVLKDAAQGKAPGQSDDDSKGDSSDDSGSKGQGQSDDDSKGDSSDDSGSKGPGQSDDDSKGDSSDDSGSKGQGQSDDDSKGDSSDDSGSKGQGNAGASKGKSKMVTAASIAAANAVLDDLDMEIQTDISMGASQAISLDANNFAQSFAPKVKLVPSMPISDDQKRVASQVNAVADDLKDALIAQAYSGKFNKLVGKRLNSRVVSRVKTGNARIFQSKTQCDGIAAAVSVLVDTSGSMCNAMMDRKSRFTGSIGVAVGLGDVLSEFDVPFELSFYDEVFYTQKTFEADWNDIRKKNSYPIPNNGTTTGAALQTALSELILRDEPKRLMIIVTDGDTTDPDLLASCYEEAKLAGIEIVSLMIGYPIPAIQRLADSVGFPVETHNSCDGIAKYVVKHVLATI